jgi:hypothetical protein
MWSLLQFLRRLAMPFLGGVALSGISFLLTQEYAQLLPLREPLDVLSAGLTGFWAVRSRLGRGGRVEIAAGIVASLLVGVVRLLLGHYLDGVSAADEYMLLVRFAIAGGIGASLSRLLHQRVVL